MKRIFFLLLLLLPTSLPARGDTPIARIDVVIPNDSPVLADLAGGVQHALQQQQPSMSVTIRTAGNVATRDSKNALVIAVGENLLPWLKAEKNNFAAALAFSVSSTAYFAQLRDEEKVTALFRDQPLSRQLQLAKALLPNLRHVGVITGHKNLPTSIAELERSSQLEIQSIDVEDRPDWPKYLSQLVANNDVLLGIDDPAIYNAENIRSILLTTYRHGKFLIGPGRSFVNAGSLASCYTAPDQYLQQLLDMVNALLRSQKLPRPQYPRAYRVAINSQVATSLGLTVPDEQTLTARLQNMLSPSSSGECGDGC